VESLTDQVRKAAADWAAVTGVCSVVFDYSERAVPDPCGQSFCERCPKAVDGGCEPQVANRFGCYEAERWGGHYIYFCPASLVFIAALVYDADTPVYGIVAGPVVMGSMDDLLDDLNPEMGRRVAGLSSRTPAEVNSLARVQQALARALAPAQPVGEAGAPAPAAAETEPGAPPQPYPVELEQRLVGMIRRGDRAGAAELINDLLAALYLSCNRDFPKLRQGATELITVFSRATIEGGADAQSIFGEKSAMDRRLAGLRTVHELSAFLVLAFERFVGYVFDFSQFRHANALHQVISYVRVHYAERITLAEVARQVWLSPSYLSAVFSAEMGMSLTAYVRKIRVDKSKDLLAGTRLSVADIAAETGFSDQSYFTKVFTKAVGVSPTQFRREHNGADHG